MKQSTKGKWGIAAVLLIAIAAIWVIVDGASSQQKTEGPGGALQVSLNDGWTIYSAREEVDRGLPYSFWGNPGQQIEFSRFLPDSRSADVQLCMQTYLSPFRVYFNGEILYEYGWKAIEEGRIVAGNGYHIIAMPSVPGELRIVSQIPPGARYLTLGDIQLTSGANYLKNLIRANMITIVSSGILLMIGCYALLSYLGATKVWGKRGASLSLSLLNFCAGFWMLGRSGLLQLFTDRIFLANALDFLSFYLIPIAGLLFFRDYLQRKKDRFLQICLGMEGAFFLFVSGSSLLRVLDFSILLPISHLLLVPCFVCLGYNLLFHCKSTVIRLGFGGLVLSAVVELAIFPWIYFEILRFNCLELGMLFLAVCMAYEWRKQNVRYQEKLIRQEMLEDLAYTDALTGLGNRAAYERNIQYMCSKKGFSKPVHLLMVDVNHLKRVNDSLGHHKGDEYLKANASLLADQIDGLGRLYRIGGDEFAAVLECSVSRLNVLIQSLSQYSEDSSEQKAANFSFGCATFDPGRDVSLQDTLQRADQNMYQSKKKSRQKSTRS